MAFLTNVYERLEMQITLQMYYINHHIQAFLDGQTTVHHDDISPYIDTSDHIRDFDQYDRFYMRSHV
jgi:hypothetical protein